MRDDWNWIIGFLTGATIGFGCAIILMAMMSSAHAQAAPEPQQIEEMERHRQEGHAEHHDVYKGWHMPDSNTPCCNERTVGPDGKVEGDCYPTDAELRPAGKENPGIKGNVWWAKRFDGEWIEIPEKIIIKEKNPDDTGSRAHLCQGDNSSYVLCFVPPTGTF
jgi:hypothetical protein